MGVHIPEGFGNITARYALTGDPEIMTTSIGVELDVDPDLQTVVNSARTAFATWQTSWSPDYSLVGCELAYALPLIGDVVYVENNTVTVGTDSEITPPPQNCTLLVRKTTAAAGRKHRGRMYFPPGRIADVDISSAGVLEAPAHAVLQGQVTTLFNSLNAIADVGQCVLLHADEADAPTTITGLALDSLIATQRRRLRGR